MKLAIMQPYFMPYIGYFQLIKAVDKFIVYDDVNYIKRGWINRNNILVNNQSSLFSIPVSKSSQNSKINEVMINSDTFEIWKQNFLRTLEYNYKKAPFYNSVMKLLSNMFAENYFSISHLATQSICLTCDYLNIECQLDISSELNIGNDLSGMERILDICLEVGATKYINPIGGVDLYSKDIFIQHGIDLSFIKSGDVIYKQFNNEFVPWLSIIDVLMFNSPEEINKMLDVYQLI